jgi:hypothetical protein
LEDFLVLQSVDLSPEFKTESESEVLGWGKMYRPGNLLLLATLLALASSSSGFSPSAFSLIRNLPHPLSVGSHCLRCGISTAKMQSSEGGGYTGLEGMTQEEIDALPDLQFKGERRDALCDTNSVVVVET